MSRNRSTIVLISLFVTVMLLGLGAYPLSLIQNELPPDIPLTASASFNPSNPDDLTNDVCVLDYFFQDTSFYYQTKDNSYQYHVVWLRAVDIDSFDLSLWNNSGYTEYLGGTFRGAGELNWLVFYGTNRFWVRSHAPMGAQGNLYIEWDAALPCKCGETVSKTIMESEQVEVYYISLSSSQTYNLSLSVPSTGDYDLYIYSGLSQRGDVFDSNGCIAWSNATGYGTDELITDYAPPTTGDYVVLIIRELGSGVFEFSYNSANCAAGIPGFAGWVLLAGLFALQVIYAWKMHRKD